MLWSLLSPVIAQMDVWGHYNKTVPREGECIRLGIMFVSIESGSRVQHRERWIHLVLGPLRGDTWYYILEFKTHLLHFVHSKLALSQWWDWGPQMWSVLCGSGWHFLPMWGFLLMLMNSLHTENVLTQWSEILLFNNVQRIAEKDFVDSPGECIVLFF